MVDDKLIKWRKEAFRLWVSEQVDAWISEISAWDDRIEAEDDDFTVEDFEWIRDNLFIKSIEIGSESE